MHRVPRPCLRVPVARHPLPWQHEHLRLMRHSRTSVLSNIIAGKCTKCTVAINRWSYHHALYTQCYVYGYICTTVHVTHVTHRHTCSWTYAHITRQQLNLYTSIHNYAVWLVRSRSLTVSLYYYACFYLFPHRRKCVRITRDAGTRAWTTHCEWRSGGSRDFEQTNCLV